MLLGNTYINEKNIIYMKLSSTTAIIRVDRDIDTADKCLHIECTKRDYYNALLALGENIDFIQLVQLDKNDILCMPVNKLDLSIRSQNCLNKAGIKIMGDLIKIRASELIQLGHLGKKSLVEIMKKMKEHDLEFVKEVDV
jgi:DNA-directed RNA polymerase alpha subunit